MVPRDLQAQLPPKTSPASAGNDHHHVRTEEQPRMGKTLDNMKHTLSAFIDILSQLAGISMQAQRMRVPPTGQVVEGNKIRRPHLFASMDFSSFWATAACSQSPDCPILFSEDSRFPLPMPATSASRGLPSAPRVPEPPLPRGGTAASALVSMSSSTAAFTCPARLSAPVHSSAVTPPYRYQGLGFGGMPTSYGVVQLCLWLQSKAKVLIHSQSFCSRTLVTIRIRQSRRFSICGS